MNFSNSVNYEKVNSIVDGITNKYGIWKFIDKNDLSQELWIKVLDLVRHYDNDLDKVPVALIARNCLNKATDIYRKEKKRYFIKNNLICKRCQYKDTESCATCPNNDRLNLTKSSYENFSNNCISHDDDIENHIISGYSSESSIDMSKSLEDKDTILKILNLFDLKSKERKYLIIISVENSIIELEDLSEEDKKLYERPEDSSERSLLKVLGYNVSKTNRPGNWMKIKLNIYNKIKEFINGIK